jgi:hypothetical protein
MEEYMKRFTKSGGMLLPRQPGSGIVTCLKSGELVKEEGDRV